MLQICNTPELSVPDIGHVHVGFQVSDGPRGFILAQQVCVASAELQCDEEIPQKEREGAGAS